MSDCSSTSCTTSVAPKRHRCPVNGLEYKEVSSRTIMHHIKQPWSWQAKRQTYYFCEDPACDVVYFGHDDSVIRSTALRTSVGIKQKSGSALVCYCFGVTAHEAAAQPEIRAFVSEKTREHVCDCEIRNPSGRCCLKDFPKA